MGREASQSVDFTGTSRFEVLRRIGAGGMGVVYEALDRDRNESVALKTLKTLNADLLLRFKNEFRALQDLSHPNLVSLGELFEERGQWFFTMEVVEGDHFLAYVRGNGASQRATETLPLSGSDAPTLDMPTAKTETALAASRVPSSWAVDQAKLRGALAQLARGLNALHAAHKVHRDIKPSNILVTPEGRLVILDFGLITDTTRQGAVNDGQLVGTLSYMAPEQTASGPVGPEADFYSVGVMLYQALTGELPIRGSTMEEILVLKRLLEPLPPSALDESVPADLDRLCTELLRIDPKSRPSGRELLRRLAEDDASEAVQSGGDDEAFVGRTAELAFLDEALRSAIVHKTAVTVLLHGESGVGKSALTRRFVERLAAWSKPPVVLSGRCYERESVPYKAVDGIVDALARRLAALPNGEASALLPRQAGLLGHIFPVLRRVPTIAAAPRTQADKLDPQILRARLFHAFRELFTRLSPSGLVLCIDDLQWADEDSLALLAEILRPPSASPILLLSTVRAAPDGTSTAKLEARLLGDVRRLEIASLPAADAHKLAAALLDRAGALAAFAEDIASEAKGHPLFIDELVRQKLLQREGRTPLRLDEALWSRIGRLDAPARNLLTLVAVAGAPIAQEKIADASKTDFADVSRVLTHLRAQNLVRTFGARRYDLAEPYHDRVREAVVARLDATARRDAHERLALAFEASEETDPEALTMHWRGAGNDAKARGYAERAADQAMRALAFDRAARLYALSIELLGGSTEETNEDRTRLRIALAAALSNAGRGAEAAREYLVAADASDAAAALDLHRKAAEQFLRSGHVDEALATFRVVLAPIGMDLPSSSKSALASLLMRRAQVRLRGLRFVERSAADVSPELLAKVDTCWFVGAGLGLVDTIVGSYCQARALLFALEAGEPARIARTLAMEAAYSSASGGRTRARTTVLLKEANTLATRLDDPYTLGWAEAATGVVATLEGRFRTGHLSCERAEATFRDRCTGTAWEMMTARWFSLWSLSYLGEIAEVSRRVPVRLQEAYDRGDLYAAIGHSTGLANLVWLAEDDPKRARSQNREALARWSQRKFHVEHWWALLADGQADLYEGKGSVCLERMEQGFADLKSSLLLMVQLTNLEALHLRARAAVMTATEPGADALALCRIAEADAAAMAKERMPWADPLVALLRAGIAHVLGDLGIAKHNLDVATAGLEAAEMALYGAAAHYRAGQLEGGDRGNALSAAALSWFERQGVKAPRRMIAMLAPGFPD